MNQRQRGRMMRRIVTLCLAVLVTAHTSAIVLIALGVAYEGVNGWLTLTDAVFSTELLAMLLKRILDKKKEG